MELYRQHPIDLTCIDSIDAALAKTERQTGFCLDWPNGTDAPPVLVPIDDVAGRVYAPYVTIEKEKAVGQ